MSTNASRDNSPFSNSASASNDIRRQSPAFRGAYHAFSQVPPTIEPLQNTYSGTNGALAAASTAGLGTRREERLSDGATRAFAGSSAVKNARRSGSLDVREPMRMRSQSREQSPSHTAALLATSRATPNREPKPSIRLNPRRPSPLRTITSDGIDSLEHIEPRDETPVGDTVSLVRLFESKEEPQNSAPVTHSVRYVNKPPLAIANPTPIRPLKRSTISSSTVSLRTLPRQTGEERAPTTSVTTPHLGAAAVAANLAGRPRAATDRSARVMVFSRPEPPAPRRTRNRPSLDRSEDSGEPIAMVRPHSQAHQNLITGSSEAFLNSAAAELRRTKLIAVPLRKPSPRPALVSYRTSAEHILDPARSGRKSIGSLDTYVPQLTVDSLANAMVASSLASSRAPSPTKPLPLPAPRQHSKHSLFHHHHSQEQMTRTPSPAKGMRQTMREPPKSDDEANFRKKRNHYIKKHHKHHEGDRKRYRNQVTERERKRYEGVWAANKGLFMDADSSNAVINVVVRDIWKRSRLPDDVLEEVWDLVGTQGSDRLGRDEFVVGMFLIDQRLKGNKLPCKVSDSIWSSVRRLTGINVPNRRH